jgi:conjugal transfer/entry exclusion protein
MNDETRLLVIFVGLTAFALLMQAIVMLVAFLVMRKKVKSLQEDVQELRTTAMPILNKSRETLEKVAPKLESVAADVADITSMLKRQTGEFQLVAGDILDRVHRQTSRVDNMFTNMADGVEHASNVVVHSVGKPVRQLTAILAGAKAFLSVLTTGRRPSQQADVVADQDIFV